MKHIPNALSALRILLIPFFVYLMMQNQSPLAGLVLVISGITDLLDGFLARSFNWTSQLGKILDPVADKLTQAAVCIVMIIKLRYYWPFFAILLAKDLIMLLAGGLLIHKGIKLEGARWFGKTSTLVFYVTMITVIFIPDMPKGVILFLLAVTTLSAVSAALMYLPELQLYIQSLNTKKTETETEG